MDLDEQLSRAARPWFARLSVVACRIEDAAGSLANKVISNILYTGSRWFLIMPGLHPNRRLYRDLMVVFLDTRNLSVC